ncbi:Transposon Tf2-8 polyprotein [Vitis vinifera]|uniref:Transposon Tf2-8 polyprotein n=1 Tax=Vitis vinifera TaxID=29760 RepID=A0A438FCR8_VITVI|nr:Transposon Tf2-8 polyprotein [Vitis vinifera]
MDLLREGLQHDPVAKSLIALAHEGKTKRFWVENDLLYTKGRRLYVPKWGNIRRNLINECHDTKWAGHPGQRRTRALLESAYYWTQIRDEVEAYVRICLVCQQDKVEQQQPRGLLKPLPIAERPWDNVTMDFIIGLPKSEDSGSIIVVVDRFSKYATFIAAPTDRTAEETTRLFLKHVVKYWGLPKFIISDCNPRFTRKFWMKLFKLMGSELHFSTSFHPQTDGQTERPQFSYNLQRSEATNKSPFELATRQQPLTPHTLTIGYTGRSPAAFKFAKGWHEQADISRSYLDKAAKKMKKWADKKRRHTEYKVGDMVFSSSFQQFKSLRLVHKGLMRRYEGPFPVLGNVDKVSYRVKLPPRLKIHHVFHVNYLKPYHEDKDDPSRGLSKRAPTTVVISYDKEIEHFLADRVIRRRGVPPGTEYLVKWKGLPKVRLAGSQQMHYGSYRRKLSDSGQKARQERLRLRARKLLETPRVGRVWKVVEKPGGIHTILHYGGRHERSPGLSREFQKSLPSKLSIGSKADLARSSVLTCLNDLSGLQEEYDSDADNLFVRVSISDIESTVRNCQACGSIMIPYPLSTGSKCGDPMYFNFECNITTARFSSSSRSLINKIPPLNLPFHMTNVCTVVKIDNFGSEKSLENSIEIEISWDPPLELVCTSSADCKDWPNSNCRTQNGTTKCFGSEKFK